MAPAFHDRDIVLFYRLTTDIHAEDVVVYRPEGEALRIGRVDAVEGDTVDITVDGLKINGYYQTESYAAGGTVRFQDGPEFPITLKDGEFFVLCDDRSQGDDSRVYGPVTAGQLKGRVMLFVRHRGF